MVLVRQVMANEPPMPAKAFEDGRKQLLESLQRNGNRWAPARRAINVLWWVTLFALPVLWAREYFLDLQVYRTGGLAWLRGVPLYVDFPGPLDGPHFPFTYPPIAAVLFSGLATLPDWLMKSVVLVTSFAALTAACVITIRKLSHRREVQALAPAAAIAAIFLEPVWETLHFGQINLVLLVMVLADCLVVHGKHRGVLIGLAAAIKLTPAVFVVFFLLRRDWRAAVNSGMAFTAAALAGFVLAPKDSVEYWFHALTDPSRIGGLAYTTNQSINGVLHRLGEGGLWLPLAATAMLLAIAVAWKTRDDLTALIAIAVGGLLASPVSWSHHWVWIVPAALAALAVIAKSRRWWPLLAAVLVLFSISPFRILPHTEDQELHWTFWQHVFGNVYVWIGLAWLSLRSSSHSSPAVRERRWLG